MDFGKMFQTWLRVLISPGETVFEEERQSEQATFATVFIWIGIATFISAIFGTLSFWVGLQTSRAVLNSDMLAQMPVELAQAYRQMFVLIDEAGPAIAGLVFCTSLFLRPISFFVVSLIWFGLAKLFGGTGEFEEQTYLLATFIAPTMIIDSVFSVVPYLGSCVSFLLLIYRLVLTYFVLKVSHRLTSGKTLGVILVLVVAVVLLFVCCGALFFLMTLAGFANSGF